MATRWLTHVNDKHDILGDVSQIAWRKVMHEVTVFYLTTQYTALHSLTLTSCPSVRLMHRSFVRLLNDTLSDTDISYVRVCV